MKILYDNTKSYVVNKAYHVILMTRCRNNNTPALQYNAYIITAHQVVAWLSGSALVSINVVTLRRARLVLGWLTVCGRVNHLGRGM